MIIKRIEDFKGGWFIGDFNPSIYRTNEFEVAVHFYDKGQIWDAHYHAVAKEINYIISGKMLLQGKELKTGNVFSLEPYEIADPEFLEPTAIVVIKTPSIPSDKYKIEIKKS